MGDSLARVPGVLNRLRLHGASIAIEQGLPTHFVPPDDLAVRGYFVKASAVADDRVSVGDALHPIWVSDVETPNLLPVRIVLAGATAALFDYQRVAVFRDVEFDTRFAGLSP